MTKELFVTLDEFEDAENYWTDKLSGEFGESKLSTSFKVVGPYKQAIHKISLSNDHSDRLLKISKGNNLSLFILLLTSFKLLIYKYTGQEDVIVTSPIYTPSNEEFNKYVVLRDYVNPYLTFKEFLLEVRNTVVEGFKNEHYPIKKLMKHLEIEDSSLLFGKVLLLENIHKKDSFKNLISDFENELIFSFQKEQDKISGDLIYDGRVFSTDFIQQLSRSYLYILDQVLSYSDIQVQNIEILPEKERNRILVDFNNTEVNGYTDRTLNELFEERVEQSFDRIAVRSSIEPKSNRDNIKYEYINIHLSYGGLNKKLIHLASDLRKSGVHANSIVGLIVENPLETVLGILSILKAGGAYLPLDANYPSNFINYIFTDSGVQTLLIESTMIHLIPDGIHPANLISIDDHNETLDYPSTLDSYNHSTDLAYMIYTSGTTGRPKGTLVDHKGIVNYSIWRIQNYHYSEKDITLQLLSYCFDGFNSNFYSSLLSGGVLMMIPDDRKMDLDYTKKIVIDFRVTNMSLVPGMYGVFLDFVEPGDWLSLRFVVLAGDTAGANIVKKSKRKIPGAMIANEYGPTETSVTAVANLNMNEDNTTIIGQPIANVQVYILDKLLKPLAPEVKGELCISGVGVTRGYLNNPEFTAKKFVKNPFVKGKRMYKSGDLAKWLPDQNIEFFGRKDNQVKIRGYRIEIEEVKKKILSFKDIKDVVIIPKEDEKAEKVLCAYFVSDIEISRSDLREYLSGLLPDYMIPSFFTQLDRFPLTRSGKIDRKKIFQMEYRSDAKENYIPPRNDLEKKLAEIWSEILGIESNKIGIDSDFIELGGHSVKATIMVSKLFKTLNVKILLSELFKLPTIRKLAEYIEKTVKVEHHSIKLAEKKEYHVLSSAQKRFFILQQMDPASTVYNVSDLYLFEGIPDREQLKKTFGQLIRRHENLRTSFVIVDGEPVQVVNNDVDFSLESYQIGQKRIFDVFEQFVRSFDLHDVPLFRIGLINIDDRKYVLMVDMHHIISDHVSQEIVVKDFLTLYRGNEPAPLKIQYKDYSEWQRAEKESEAIKKQEQYWLENFRGEIPELNLPIDFPRPKVQSFEGTTYNFEIGVEESQRIKELAINNGLTMFMLFLGIHNVFLAKICNQEDIVVGTPIEGRFHPDLELIIGMFSNTLPLRNFPEDSMTFSDFMKEVKTRTLEAFENQNYQFEDLVDRLVKRKDTSRNPIFDVFYVLANREPVPSVQGEAGGMNSKLKEISHQNTEIKSYKEQVVKTSPFDLILIVIVEDRIRCAFMYSTKLFRRETIERFKRYFLNIMRKVTENPQVRLGEIELLSDEEQNKIFSSIIKEKKKFSHLKEEVFDEVF
jgi:amino acid adenylation domain-containing protein